MPAIDECIGPDNRPDVHAHCQPAHLNYATCSSPFRISRLSLALTGLHTRVVMACNRRKDDQLPIKYFLPRPAAVGADRAQTLPQQLKFNWCWTSMQRQRFRRLLIARKTRARLRALPSASPLFWKPTLRRGSTTRPSRNWPARFLEALPGTPATPMMQPRPGSIST